MLQQKWLYNKLVDMSLNLEERLEDILKTEISSSLYCVNNELGTFMAHPINQGDYAYSFVSLKRKNFISVTPLKAALNALILALNDSAKALVALLTKKFKTSS